jgi:hypothetical protein
MVSSYKYITFNTIKLMTFTQLKRKGEKRGEERREREREKHKNNK